MNIHKLSKFGRVLIYVSLFIPLFMVPGTIWEYVFVRSIIFYCLSAALILSALVYLYKNKHGIDFKVGALFWLLSVFVAVRIVSGFWGVDSHKSFWGSMARMDGNLGYIMLFAWLVAALVFLDSGEKWHRVFKTSSVAALIVAAFAIVQAFFPEDWGAFAGKGATSFWNHRLAGSLGNSIFLAGYLLPHIFICLYLAVGEARKKKFFWLASALFLCVIMFLTQTRGAIISFIIAASAAGILAGVLFLKKKKGGLFRAALFGAPFVAAIGIIAFGTGFLSRMKGIFLLGSGTAATRLLMWKIGLAGWIARPVLGWGPENYSYIFSKFYNPELLKFSFYETWADKPHNQFIEILGTSGVLGFALYLAVFIFAAYVLLKMAFRSQSAREFLPPVLFFGAILGFLGHIFFAFDTPELRLVLFMIFGYVIFSASHIFGNAKKLSAGFVRGIAVILSAAAVFSLGGMGIKTIQAARYTSGANENLINNAFFTSQQYFAKLKSLNTPYINDSWEYLSDTVLKADAIGRIPRTNLGAILPIVADGMARAAGGNAISFSYHYRVAQMYNLVGTYIDGAYLDKALTEANTAENISPKRQVAGILLGQIYYEKKDLPKAIATMEKIVQDDPGVGEPYWFLGILYDAAGNYQKSYAYTSTAVDKGRGLRDINEKSLYATILGRMKDYARMAPVYESLTQDQPENAGWWANLAATYLELKRYDEARKAARQAIFLSPPFGDEGANFLKKVDKAEAAGK